mmetsp:Transcript_3204/g.6555  ORF Transcript_3204/g.6555 Transcript_3204/m.6555 type:complete len:884 (+) Transcript_3204:302-2953(+)
MPNLPLKPPPRPQVSTAGFVGATKGADGGETMESNQPMPHVVRVTFLGVAGILAKPCNESFESPKTSASVSEGFIRASPDHPSLLIPVPSNLRVVATVSRTRTAKGIPSGLSKCLISSRPPSLVDHPNSSPKSTNATNEITETITTTLMHDKVATQITIHTKQNHSFSEDGSIFTEPKTVEGEHQSASLSVVTENVSLPKHPPVPSTPCPPSQLMQGRTGCEAACGFGGNRIGSSIASRSAPVESNEVHEFVEVVGPSRSKGCSSGKSADETMETAPSEETDNDNFCLPQRYVATWDEKADRKGTRDLRGASDLVGDSSRLVNNTNVLAFEAELRPVSAAVITTASKTPPTPFAPKMFCVTVGLIPDIDNRIVASSSEKSEKNATDSKQKSKTPYFAIPLGLAHLVIRGTETLDGKRLQVDLPLASLSQFMGSFGGETNAAKEFPVMELSSESISSKEEKSKNSDENKDGKNIKKSDLNSDKNKIKKKDDKSKEQGGKQHKPKSKKKGIMSRMFSRSKQSSSLPSAPSPALVKQQEEEEKMPVYNGDPRSIFDLGRPPNSRERALFSERYGIDPSGDAVIRIGLEVFPRGSELEKIFRQKHRLRREQRKKALAATNNLESHAEPVRKSQSFGSLSRSSSKGSESYSLVDDEDETLLDSDSDYSESFVSLDSNTSGSIWDESTLETDATDTYYSLHSRSESFMTNSVITDAETSFTETVATPKTGRSSKSSSVFGRVLDCKLETSDSSDRANQSNEVTRGLANFTNLFFACNGLELDNNSEMTTLLKPRESKGVMPFGKDFHKKLSADDQSSHKKYVAGGRDEELERSSTGASNEIGFDNSLEISQNILLEGEEEASHHDDSTVGVSNENLEGHEITLEQLSQD